MGRAWRARSPSCCCARGGRCRARGVRPGGRTTAAVQSKAGGSPVTEADFAAERQDLKGPRLGEAFPEAGWLSEETPNSGGAARPARATPPPSDRRRRPPPALSASTAPAPTQTPPAGHGPRPTAARACAPRRTKPMRRRGRLPCQRRAAGVRGPRRGGRLQARRAEAAPQGHGRPAGATLDIRPFVPSLAYRMCMAASGALDFAVAGANSNDRQLRPPICWSRRRADVWWRRPANGCSRNRRARIRARSRGAGGVGAALARRLSRGDRRGTSGISRVPPPGLRLGPARANPRHAALARGF